MLLPVDCASYRAPEPGGVAASTVHWPVRSCDSPADVPAQFAEHCVPPAIVVRAHVGVVVQRLEPVCWPHSAAPGFAGEYTAH